MKKKIAILVSTIFILVIISCSDKSKGFYDNDSEVVIDSNSFDDTDSLSIQIDTEEQREPWVEKPLDINELPEDVVTVEILISSEAKAQLESAPFYGDDVTGTFIDENGVRYENVDLNFRGAYKLRELINNDPIGRRNWKVKFASNNMYRNRREWNFNFEPNLRQKLAYDLMKFAGVKVPNAEHVILKVNNEAMGLYLRYEDPDSKNWLYDSFGNDEGDLYKAATDVPASEGRPEMKYFALTDYLGEADSNYLSHYNKKTNHKNSETSQNYSVIRNFLLGLNFTASEDLLLWLQEHLEIESYISYLAVSNYISNWDSFPQRPKNYWLFENRRTDKIAFIPWDMDGTFQTWVDDYNQMGPTCSIFYNLKQSDYRPIHSQEGTSRPLAYKLLNLSELERKYLLRYKELQESILSHEFLQTRLNRLDQIMRPYLTDRETPGWMSTSTEREDYENALEDMKDFISERDRSVSEQLRNSF